MDTAAAAVTAEVALQDVAAWLRLPAQELAKLVATRRDQE